MDSSKNGDTYLRVYCDCGIWLRGDIEIELISNVRNHIDEAHATDDNFKPPSDEVILGNAERVPV